MVDPEELRRRRKAEADRLRRSGEWRTQKRPPHWERPLLLLLSIATFVLFFIWLYLQVWRG